jgi:three-Cys-motif partner protein
MAVKDLHDSPFDDNTIVKLEIFEDYAQAWLPTFVMQAIPVICIYDFFAGTGYAKNNVPGSPIRILEKIREQIGYIFQKRVKVKVFFNEFEPNKKEQKKYHLLKNSCEDFIDQNRDIKRALETGTIEIVYYNEDCEILFPKLIDDIRKYPSLVYLDQNGIKFLSNKYLLELANTKQTDFLYFVSTSYFWRFGNSPEFKEHLEIDVESAKRDPYKFIHKNVIGQLKSQLPPNTNLKLYPYTIKKGTNIYGIIFGASHPRAVEKFLSLAWKRNPINGEANFDIDEDIQKVQLDIFAADNKRLTKIESFRRRVREAIYKGEIKNNIDTFIFTINSGHIPDHAREEVIQMRKEGLISFKGHSKISYDSWATKDIVEFEKAKQ